MSNIKGYHVLCLFFSLRQVLYSLGKKKVLEILQGQVTKCADALKPRCEAGLDMVMLGGPKARQIVRCKMENNSEEKE